MSEITSESPQGATDTGSDMPDLPRRRGQKSKAGGNLVLLPTPQGKPPTPRRPTLSTAMDVKREMGKLYRLARAQMIPLEDASKATYILTSIAKIIEASELEARIKALEDRRS
jgi:hypothetical protein